MKNQVAIIEKKDLDLANELSLTEKQLNILLKKTPAKYVHQRPAKGGGTWDYVTVGYVKKVLNLMFGFDWDFEILDEKILEDEAIVKGKLTCRTGGKTIVKMQYGNKDIVRMRSNGKPISIGNDLKSASSDCLKKCAAEIGIAADIYNKLDFNEVQVVEESRPDFYQEIAKAETREELELLWSAMDEKEQINYKVAYTNRLNQIK